MKVLTVHMAVEVVVEEVHHYSQVLVAEGLSVEVCVVEMVNACEVGVVMYSDKEAV